eukprot:CAMPEP_0178417726 /NCGR_PEP_ID=MMETSP0689_2-20121128/24719_1 /TAXON_ID=160604 /ORGANISM="Amphidinium massartii, Strain CS-259" /LENGTH=474 /DNA_ID=CAMNT_0020039093 /DNA_START=122 /DNA_END=1546 /DNA_ORIENTATION=+
MAGLAARRQLPSSKYQVDAKNTFIHFDVQDLLSPTGRPTRPRCQSCPRTFPEAARTLPLGEINFDPAVWKCHSDGSHLEEEAEQSDDSTSCSGSIEYPSERTEDVGGECNRETMAFSSEPRDEEYEQKCRDIGCRGCGCLFPVVCVHAAANRCNKAKCRYCHCPFTARAGTGAPAPKKQRTKTYIDRMHAGDLSGKQYLALLAHLLSHTGKEFLLNAPIPAWLMDENELQIIARSLVLAFAQKSKALLAKETLQRIFTWMLEALPPHLEESDFQQVLLLLQEHINDLSVEGLESAGLDEDVNLKALRHELLKDKSGQEVLSRNWPKKSEENGLATAPWLGVTTGLTKAFAFELYVQSPQSPIFTMDNILGNLAREVRSGIVKKQLVQMLCAPLAFAKHLDLEAHDHQITVEDHMSAASSGPSAPVTSSQSVGLDAVASPIKAKTRRGRHSKLHRGPSSGQAMSMPLAPGAVQRQ